MKHYPALVLDDEPLGRQLVVKMLQRHLPQVSPIYPAESLAEAAQIAHTHRPAILLLDIEVHDESAFGLLAQIPSYGCEIIFTTAHDNYASQAFRVHAADYLLKPIVAAELKEAVYNAIQRIETETTVAAGYKTTVLPPSVTIPTIDGFSLLRPAEILYGKAVGNYTEMVMRNRSRITSSATLGHFEAQLSAYGFFRIHRSYLINLAEILAYRKGEGGFVEMSDGNVLELSRHRKAEFMALFKTQQP